MSLIYRRHECDEREKISLLDQFGGRFSSDLREMIEGSVEMIWEWGSRVISEKFYDGMMIVTWCWWMVWGIMHFLPSCNCFQFILIFLIQLWCMYVCWLEDEMIMRLHAFAASLQFFYLIFFNLLQINMYSDWCMLCECLWYDDNAWCQTRACYSFLKLFFFYFKFVLFGM